MSQPTETALPPYSGQRPRCPKCGDEGASTTYMQHGSCFHYGSDYEVHGDDPNERLHRACRNCGYQWDEAIQPD